ncbi:hypothetical protein PG985_011465 [Apiospora marii]|uniref:uncharacterized protein n=1 Tax=Apiospora marii TaxID=335849 RepID=UPI0031322404
MEDLNNRDLDPQSYFLIEDGDEGGAVDSRRQVDSAQHRLHNYWAKLDCRWIDIDEVLHWLFTCEWNHPICRSVAQTTGEIAGRPLWLIDIHQECIVPAQHIRGEYLALSYVWGEARSGELTHQSISALQQPGALGTQATTGAAVVPRTVHHAMGLVGLLKQDYLWVDRFCINQDDAESKHSQSQTMADIYDGAYLTIVTAAGRDANHGLAGLKGITGSRNLMAHMEPLDYKKLTDPNRTIWNNRNFTYPEDVHAAFLGVAKQFLPSFPKGLWWGLPVQHLDTALLWQPMNGECLSRRRAKSVTLPSWSWMGWRGAVRFTWGISSIGDSGSQLDRIIPQCQWEQPGFSDLTEPINRSVCLLRLRISVTRTTSIIADYNDWGNTSRVSAVKMDIGHYGIIYWTEQGSAHWPGQPCELIALSSIAAYQDKPPLNSILDRFIADFDQFRSRGTPESEIAEEIYFVMAVKRENGIAYREGLGVMYKRDWDVLEAQVEDVVLG